MEGKKKKKNKAINSGSGLSMDWNQRQVNCGFVSVWHEFIGRFVEKSKVLTAESRAETYFQRNKTCWDNRIKVKLEIRNGYFVLGFFLKRTKGLREEIRPLQVVHSFSVTGGTPPS